MNERKHKTNYLIKEFFIRAIKCAKHDNKYCAKEYLQELNGCLFYMQFVGDISEEIYNKLYKLKWLVIKKYDLY